MKFMSRPHLEKLAAATAIALAACANHVNPHVTEWPMYQMQPDHNAVVNRPGFIAAWQFDAGARINGGLALSGDTLLLDTFGQEVIALDARNGSVLWRTRGDNVLMSTPVVARGRVFIGSGHNGRLETPPDSKYTYTPNLGGNPIWGRPQGDSIFALDVLDGSKLWAHNTVGEDMPSPAFANGILTLANGDLHAYGLNSDNGKPVWIRKLDGLSTMSSATIANGAVFLSICNDAPYRCQTDSLDPANGAIRWRAPYGNSDSSPTVADGRVYVSGVENIVGLYPEEGRAVVDALDAKSGRRLWTYRAARSGPYTEVGSSERAIAGSYSNGTYYQAIPNEDELVAFNAATGRVRWRFRTTGPVKMSCVVYKDHLYVGDTAGILYVLNSTDGSLITARILKQPFTTSPPIVVGDTLFVAADTSVYAIRLR